MPNEHAVEGETIGSSDKDSRMTLTMLGIGKQCELSSHPACIQAQLLSIFPATHLYDGVVSTLDCSHMQSLLFAIKNVVAENNKVSHNAFQHTSKVHYNT